MMDISPTLLGKGKQLNADDLMGGDKIITITRVTLSSSPDQPLHIHYEGDGDKPYKPCVSMRRVIAHMWGTDGSAFKGRKLRLFRDESVVYAGEKVGGIRINGASHISEKVTCKVTARRGKKATIIIDPLLNTNAEAKIPQGQPNHTTTEPGRLELEKAEKAFIAAIERQQTLDNLEKLTSGDKYTRFTKAARDQAPEVIHRVTDVLNRKLEQLQNMTQPDPIQPGRWPEEEMPA